MSTFTEERTYTFVVIHCYLCDCAFAIREDLQRNLKKTHNTFYCPMGHGQVYSEDPREKKIKELTAQVERERSDKAWYIGRLNTEQSAHKHTAAQLRGTKAVVTRFKKKVVEGRCPCCSHQFKNLERHMKNQHPNFDPDKAAAALAEKVAE